MKQTAALLLIGLVGAGFAWLFWHWVGEQGAGVLLVLMLIVVSADNFRLRRLLRAKG